MRSLFSRVGYGPSSSSSVRRPNLLPLLRLLMPQGDKARPTYGVREANIAELYISALALDPHSSTAQRLKRWKQPQPPLPGHSSAPLSGDFATVLRDVLAAYEQVREGDSQWTLDDVNGELDCLAGAFLKEERRSVFARLLKHLSAAEHFYLVRVMLHDVKVGIGQDTLLRMLHPKALDAFNTSSSLQVVCDLLQDPQRLREAASVIEYFHAFKPMLSSIPRDWQSIPATIGGRRYWWEDKFDGERLLVHKKEGVVRLYSRKGNDLSERYNYGASLDGPLLEALTVDCIVDGELMSWDRTLHRYIPFGNNRTTAITGRLENKQLTVILFDMLKVTDQRCPHRPRTAASTPPLTSSALHPGRRCCVGG